ncbi:MAG: hydroxyacylglutathione hydrolase [Halothiobacillaceae bacterium]
MIVHRVDAFKDNYIWLASGEDGARCAIVDPGDAEAVLAALDRLGLTPTAILLTHHHADHSQGIPALLERFDIPVHGPAREAGQWVTVPHKEGDSFTVEGVGRFEVLDTPGHTLGHISFVGPGVLFCGDTLFTAGSGRLFEGTAEQMQASLEKLAALPDDTQVYCGHEYTEDSLRFAAHAEPENDATLQRVAQVRAARARGEATVPATMALERATNPFLRVRDPALRAAAERHAGRVLADDADALGVIRRWKDDFDGLAPL